MSRDWVRGWGHFFHLATCTMKLYGKMNQNWSPKRNCLIGEFDTTPGGSTPGFKWQGWSNGGKNQNPKKSLDQNLTPKKSLAEFPSHKNLQKALNYITRKTETLVLNTPKNTFLNQATPRKYLPKFSYPKKSRNRKFQTPKNPSIIPVTWNPKDTLGTHPDRVSMSISKWPMTVVL